MKEFLLNLVEKLWLKKNSIPFAFLFLMVGYIALATALDGWTWCEVPTWVFIVAAVVLFSVGIVYTIACVSCDHLPKAPKETLAVLFCIDAESEQLFETAKFKLVDKFNMQIVAGGTAIQALCVSKLQIAKYNIQDKANLLSLLEKTNSVLFVYVRYTTDDVNNAENFELCINCAVSHPKFSEKAEYVISQDLRMMKKSVGRQRFTKENAINVFNFTAQTLVCACQYILGFVYLLAGNNQQAFKLLILAKKNIAVEKDDKEAKLLEKLIEDRIFSTLCQIGQDMMIVFQDRKTLEHLEQLGQILNIANGIRPDTFFYNMNMAYVHVALNHDASAAKLCIEKCKASKENKDWMYSDAFLSAYCGHAPTTILKKYSKAFKVPYKSLVEIVDYIEFIIDAEPEKVALHLAAGLVYGEMGEVKLMRQHLSTYLTCGTGINQKTKELLTAKISAQDCGENCKHDCVQCAS